MAYVLDHPNHRTFVDDQSRDRSEPGAVESRVEADRLKIREFVTHGTPTKLELAEALSVSVDTVERRLATMDDIEAVRVRGQANRYRRI